MDINKLRQAIRSMTRNTALYKALKEELSALGYWRNKARGNPSKGYQAQQSALARG